MVAVAREALSMPRSSAQEEDFEFSEASLEHQSTEVTNYQLTQQQQHYDPL
jgi:hypothetical protein